MKIKKIDVKKVCKVLRPILWKSYLVLILLIIVYGLIYVPNKQLEVVRGIYNLTIQKSNNSCQILARNTLNSEVSKFETKENKITDIKKQLFFNRVLEECLFAEGLSFLKTEDSAKSEVAEDILEVEGENK